MLFTQMERTDTEPRPYAKPRFSYLDRSARPEAERVRACFEEWFLRYPEDEQASFLSAFRSPKDSQFVSAAFELYLHELLLCLDYRVQVHPENPTGASGRPDFLATAPDNSRLYVEAALVTYTSAEEGSAKKRMDVVYDLLNKMGPTDFFLGMDMRGAPATPPPTRKLRNYLMRWLDGLNADEIEQRLQVSGTSDLPKYKFEHDGWEIEFEAIPKSKGNRGKQGVRPIGYLSDGVKMVSWREAIRDVVVAKGTKYGELPEALLIAVNLGHFDIDKIDIMQALFGQEQFFFPGDEPEMMRAPNGVWTSPSGPRYRRVSAVLIVPDLHPWTVATRSVRIYHNPWANHHCKGPICSLPQCVPEGDKMKNRAGTHPREILCLPEGWPE